MDNNNINEEQLEEGIKEENEEKIPDISEIREFRKGIIQFLFFIILILLVVFITIPTTMQNTRKPAIYLYPEKTTTISVKLDKSIKYNNVIPTYKNGWLIEAKPNGDLRDLQPKCTKCNKLPYKEFGFEYSKQACEINKYPYIYWDGIQLYKPLPTKKEGFIVKADNISEFLAEKADEIKFNKTEKAEFIRYWSKTILEKNWKEYKIYFLQNEEVDNYYPIYIEPKPESSNRVQMVIKKAKKNEKINEQKLLPIKRNAYTLVEWGGII